MRAFRRALLLGLLVLVVASVPLAPRMVVLLTGELVGNAAVTAALARAPGRGEPLIVLVVGSDSREQLPAGFGSGFGSVSGQRADTVILVETIPGSARVQLLSLPRDLLVTVDRQGQEPLGVAYQHGPRALVDTVRRLTGLPIHHFVAIDFYAFARLVDRVGGLTLEFPHPARDRWSGLRVEAGRRALDGTTALAYVRARHYEELVGGRWRPVGNGDLGRIERQQRLLAAMAARARQVTSPLALLGLARAVRQHVSADRGLAADGPGLLRRLSAAGPGGISVRTLPVEPITPLAARLSPFPPLHLGAFGDVRPVQPAAGVLLEAFRAGRPLPPGQESSS